MEATTDQMKYDFIFDCLVNNHGFAPPLVDGYNVFTWKRRAGIVIASDRRRFADTYQNDNKFYNHFLANFQGNYSEYKPRYFKCNKLMRALDENHFSKMVKSKLDMLYNIGNKLYMPEDIEILALVINLSTPPSNMVFIRESGVKADGTAMWCLDLPFWHNNTFTAFQVNDVSVFIKEEERTDLGAVYQVHERVYEV